MAETKNLIFKATSFEEGWKKIKESLIEAQNLFEGVDDNIDAVNNALIEIFKSKIPLLNTPVKNRSWALNIQTTKSSLKANNISYGWKIDKSKYIKMEKGNSILKIEEITFSIILYDLKNQMYQEKSLLDAGFTVKE